MTAAKATTRTRAVRVVREDGKPIALVRAVSNSQAIRHALRKRFSAHIAEQDDLLDATVKTLDVQDAAETDE